jgi:hypothetical protein
MTEKRFEAGNLKIQDTAPKGRVYLLDRQGGVNALCSLINGLNDKSNRLEKENEQLKSDNNRLVNETAKIVAEHQKKALDLIDRKINDCENIKSDIESLWRREALKELKKELIK